MKTLYIKIFNEKFLNEKRFYFAKDYLKDILAVCNELNGHHTFEKAICFYAHSSLNSKNCMELSNVISICADGVMTIKFESHSNSKFTTESIKKNLRKTLIRKNLISYNDYIPNCYILDEELNPESGEDISEKIDEQISKCEWYKVFELTGYHYDIKKTDLWNDCYTLDKIAFAFSKLSNASCLPELLKKDYKKFKEEEKIKHKFRNAERSLRKRCIDLYPEKASYYANFAYFHYNACTELKNRYRKDGNISEHIEQAKENFKIALERDPSRIKEYYRYGRLLTDIAAENILYANKSETFYERYKKSQETKIKGIEILKKGIDIYKTLIKDSGEYKRCRKEYIRSLYTMSFAIFSMVKNVWDIEFLVYNETLRNNQSYDIEQDIKNINESISIFHNGCNEDHTSKNLLTSDEYLNFNGEFTARNKYYTLGKYHLALAFIYHKTGDIDLKKESLEKAGNYLIRAENLKSPSNGTFEPKGHIYERICRLHILNGKPELATKLYEKNYEFSKRIKPYEAYTVSIAYKLIGDYEKANKVLEKHLDSKFNMDRISGYIITGVCSIDNKNYDEAEKSFNKALEISKEKGIKSIDTILISLAHCEYNKGNKETANKYLEEALKINPRRVAALKKVLEWN